MVIGSPADQRAYRFDEQRINDLQNIQSQVINYWQQKEVLPENLDTLKNPISNYMIPLDPEFNKGNVYEYKKTSDLSFELCATFSMPIPEGYVDNYSGGGVKPTFDMAVSSYPYMGGGGDSWKHDVGKTCFERTIDKDLYPPYSKIDR